MKPRRTSLDECPDLETECPFIWQESGQLYFSVALPHNATNLILWASMPLIEIQGGRTTPGGPSV